MLYGCTFEHCTIYIENILYGYILGRYFFLRPQVDPHFPVLPVRHSENYSTNMSKKIIYRPTKRTSQIVIEVLEWINNLIPRFTVHVITFPCKDYSYLILVKGAPGKPIKWQVSGPSSPGKLNQSQSRLPPIDEDPVYGFHLDFRN